MKMLKCKKRKFDDVTLQYSIGTGLLKVALWRDKQSISYANELQNDKKCCHNATFGRPVPKFYGTCSGVASIGAWGGIVPPPLDSEKSVKTEKSGKEMKNREKSRKRGKIEKKMQKSGRFFHFAPPDKLGWLRFWEIVCIHNGIAQPPSYHSAIYNYSSIERHWYIQFKNSL